MLKTLKRIGLFLYLKLKEISLPVIGAALVIGIVYLMGKYCPLVFLALLIISCFITGGKEISILFINWSKGNWKEVKRRIP